MTRTNWLSRWPKFSIALSLASAVLGTLSLEQARFSVGFPSSISILPSAFFVALVLLTVAANILWLSRDENNALSLCQWSLLNAAFWLVPLVFGNWLPGGFHAYEFFGFTEYIVRKGHVHPDAGRLFYHNWPGLFIYTAILMQVLGLDKPDTLIKVSPFVAQLAYLGGLYPFFRNTLGSKSCWFGLWLFTLGNWQQHNTLLPQTYAFALLFLMFAIFTKWPRPPLSHTSHDLILLLLFVAMIISHVLTTLLAFSAMSALYFSRKYPAWGFVGLALVTTTSWMLYGGASFLEKDLFAYVRLTLQLVGRFKESLFEAVRPASTGSAAHQHVVALRFMLMALVFSIGLLGATFKLRPGRVHGVDLAIVALGVGISSVALTTELLDSGVFSRVYTSILPLVSYFGAITLDKKIVRWVVMILLIVAGPLHVAAHEGNQVIDYVPSGYIEGLRFFHAHTSGGTVTEARALEGDPPPFGGFERREKYMVIMYRWPHWEGILDAISGGQMGRPPSYIITSEILDRPVTEFLSGDSAVGSRIESVLKNSRNSTVYANGTVAITLLERPY